MGIDILPAGINPNGFYPANGPNQAAQFPVIGSASPTSVTGRACASCTVEVFTADGGANAFGDGQHLRGLSRRRRERHVHGARSLSPGDFVTSTATDAQGNTSEFSLNRAVTASGDTARWNAARPRPVLAHRHRPVGHGDASAAPGPSPRRSPDYDVAGGVGTIVVPAAGQQRASLLSSLAQRDIDMTMKFATDKLATGGNHWVYVVAARSSAGEYRGSVRMAANGTVFVSVQPRRRGDRDDDRPRGAVSGLTHTPGAGIWVRMQATGASPTTLRVEGLGRRRARADRPGTSTQTNSEAALQDGRRSSVLRTYVGSASRTHRSRVTFDELRASVAAPDDGVAPAAPQNLVATPAAIASRSRGRRTARATSSATTSTARRRTPVPTTGIPLSGSGPVTDAAYVDTTAVNDTTYHYVVVAADSTARRSAASNDAAATPNAAAGSGLQLNGTSQYVTLGAAPALNTSNFTLELWFRRTGAGVGTSTGTAASPTPSR